MQFTLYNSVGKYIGTAGLLPLVVIYGKVLQLAQLAISVLKGITTKLATHFNPAFRVGIQKWHIGSSSEYNCGNFPPSGAVMNWGRLAPSPTFQCKNQDPDTTVPTVLESDAQEYPPLHPA